MSQEENENNNDPLLKQQREEERIVVRLKDFPRASETKTTYGIDVKLQKQKSWQALKHPFPGCGYCHRDTSKTYWAVLFWLGIILSTMSLGLSFVKDSHEHDTIPVMLYYSIAEMITGMTAILVLFLKHVVKWRGMKRSHKGILEPKPAIKGKMHILTILRNPFTKILVAWISLELTILIGFTLLYSLDKDQHAYLTYTKYTTTAALFLAENMDVILTDLLHKVITRNKMDVYRLVIHELKQELFIIHSKMDNIERVKSIEQYIQAQDIFKIHDNDHIKEC